jgi:hypothetical protein
MLYLVLSKKMTVGTSNGDVCIVSLVKSETIMQIEIVSEYDPPFAVMTIDCSPVDAVDVARTVTGQ